MININEICEKNGFKKPALAKIVGYSVRCVQKHATGEIPVGWKQEALYRLKLKKARKKI